MESAEITPALRDLTAVIGAIRVLERIPGQLPTCDEVAAAIGTPETVEPVTVPAGWPPDDEMPEEQDSQVVWVPVRHA